VLLELEVALAFAGCGTCAELVDIPVGDTGAVVFSFKRAFPAVTFCASKVVLTPVAFTPVAFPEVVVVPLVVVGIMVFPIIVLLVGTKPLEGDPLVDDGNDELFVLLCCADTNRELLIVTNANANTIAIERLVTTIHMIDCFLESML
jgi:hypothetical protein